MEKLGTLPDPSSVRSVCTVIFLCPAEELEFYKNGVSFPRRFLLLWLNSILQSLRYILWFLTQPETQPQGRESHCRNPALGSFLFFLSVPLSFQRRFKYPHRVDKNKQINKKKTSYIILDSSPLLDSYALKAFALSFQCLLLILKSCFWNCFSLYICGEYFTQKPTSAWMDGGKRR